MKSNHGRHRPGNTVAEVAAHGVAHHLVQFLNRLGLRGNGMAQSGGDITAVRFILLNFKNDFAHGNILSGLFAPGKRGEVTACVFLQRTAE